MSKKRKRKKRCNKLVVLLAYGVARCELRKGHCGRCDTTAFDVIRAPPNLLSTSDKPT